MVIFEKGESKVVECSIEGCEYEGPGIGNHWQYYPDHRQRFTDEQIQILTGIFMSDGSINRGEENRNPLVSINGFTTPIYLEYLDNLFGVLSIGVKPDKTAGESAEDARDTGISPDARVENYSDKFRWGTRRHPQLEVLDSWTSFGDRDKKWPEDIELTPLVLKHLYCGDGSWSNKNGNNRIQITTSNEHGNENKITSIFKNAKLPSPGYSEYVNDDGTMGCKIYFSVQDSKVLWSYMGSPPPGFEYKWPEEYRGEDE